MARHVFEYMGSHLTHLSWQDLLGQFSRGETVLVTPPDVRHNVEPLALQEAPHGAVHEGVGYLEHRRHVAVQVAVWGNHAGELRQQGQVLLRARKNACKGEVVLVENYEVGEILDTAGLREGNHAVGDNDLVWLLDDGYLHDTIEARLRREMRVEAIVYDVLAHVLFRTYRQFVSLIAIYSVYYINHTVYLKGCHGVRHHSKPNH